MVSHVLQLPSNKVVVQAPRMGGGFGGKETQGNTWAAIVALAAWQTGRAVRVQLDRDLDMVLTGKRHPFLARYTAGFDEDGRAARAARRARLRRRLGARSVRVDPRPRALPPRQRLLRAGDGADAAGSRGPTSSRTPPSAASAGRRACWSWRRSSTASRARSAFRPRWSASATSIAAPARPTPRTTARRSATTGSSRCGRRSRRTRSSTRGGASSTASTRRARTSSGAWR